MTTGTADLQHLKYREGSMTPTDQGVRVAWTDPNQRLPVELTFAWEMLPDIIEALTMFHREQAARDRRRFNGNET